LDALLSAVAMGRCDSMDTPDEPVSIGMDASQVGGAAVSVGAGRRTISALAHFRSADACMRIPKLGVLTPLSVMDVLV
jgi:hypothetical protein